MHSDNEMVNLRSVIETLCYMVDDDSDGVEEVMQLPSIDIVRCKECKYARNIESEWICEHLSGMVGLNVLVNDDDFCLYGVRKTNTTAEEKLTPIRDYMVHGEREGE